MSDSEEEEDEEEEEEELSVRRRWAVGGTRLVFVVRLFCVNSMLMLSSFSRICRKTRAFIELAA